MAELPVTIWVYDRQAKYRQGADPWDEWSVVGETARSILIKKDPTATWYEPTKVPKKEFYANGFTARYYSPESKRMQEWFDANANQVVKRLESLRGWSAWVLFKELDNRLPQRGVF